MTSPLRGLTWDHPRGYRALERLVAGPLHPGATTTSTVVWERQSLLDFEARPLRYVADDYDLVVIDHPSLGEAVADDCLLPLDQVVAAPRLRELCQSAVGQSSESYFFSGRQWAVPVDAATQVSVVRPDLMAERPAVWEAAVRADSVGRIALCLGGPHALLMLSSVCLALGEQPATGPEVFVDHAVGLEALGIMRAILGRSIPQASMLNPIQLLELMANDNAVAYCPIVYAYLPYQLGQNASHVLEFFDAPSGQASGLPASVLGGAGMAVTRSCSNLDEARALIEMVYDSGAQRAIYLEEGAHSVLTEVWHDSTMAGTTRGFYLNTRRTIENAWVRPRFDGYVPFQSNASEAVRCGLMSEEAPHLTLERVDDLYRAALMTDRGSE
jgi:multiple sugar transport system substrate-binding protein